MGCSATTVDIITGGGATIIIVRMDGGATKPVNRRFTESAVSPGLAVLSHGRLGWLIAQPFGRPRGRRGASAFDTASGIAGPLPSS